MKINTLHFLYYVIANIKNYYNGAGAATSGLDLNIAIMLARLTFSPEVMLGTLSKTNKAPNKPNTVLTSIELRECLR